MRVQLPYNLFDEMLKDEELRNALAVHENALSNTIHHQRQHIE